jgi:D-sedoheptulose 7-phosphate isomerase
MNLQQQIARSLHEAEIALHEFRHAERNIALIEEAARMIAASLHSSGKVIACGNGGSMCDAMHFAEELSGRFRQDRKGLAAMAIADPSHITCVGNDYGFEFIFSRFVEAVGKPGDVLFAISTSGNSANVLRAAEAAREKGMNVIALTGKDGGKLAGLADVEIRAPHAPFADRAQEIHIKVIHCLIESVEQLCVGGG